MSDGPALSLRVASLAARVAAGVRALALLSLIAGIWVWSALCHPFQFAAWWIWIPAVILLAALTTPGVVLLALHAALRDLVRLPARVRATGGATHESAVRVVEIVKRRRRWWLPRAAWELWRLLADNRELLAAYTGLMRLVTPMALLMIGVAVAGSMVLIAVALGSAVVVIL